MAFEGMKQKANDVVDWLSQDHLGNLVNKLALRKFEKGKKVQTLSDTELSRAEQNYIRDVIVKALGIQAEQQGDLMAYIFQLHQMSATPNAACPDRNIYKTNGVDTLGLVSEALSVIQEMDYCEEIRDHGIGYARTRIPEKIAFARQQQKIERDWERLPQPPESQINSEQ